MKQWILRASILSTLAFAAGCMTADVCPDPDDTSAAATADVDDDCAQQAPAPAKKAAAAKVDKDQYCVPSATNTCN